MMSWAGLRARRTADWAARLSPQDIVLLGMAVLALYYTAIYLAYPGMPGNRPDHPHGWFDWADQGRTIASSRAFARWDWAPDAHWYPPGYSAVGALFLAAFPGQPFFFPDLAALLVGFLAFVSFAGRLSVPARWSVPLFLLTVGADRRLFLQWIAPWNTTPVAAMMWGLLALLGAHAAGAPRLRSLRPAAIGFVLGLIVWFRPTDILVAGLCVAVVALTELRGRRASWRDAAGLLAGAVVGVLPGVILHLRIHGLHPSQYMLESRQVGFTLYDFAWKAFIILSDPSPWVGDGEGFLQRSPWIALGLMGLAASVTRLRTPSCTIRALLAIGVAAQTVLYLSYVDLQPRGFWRYMNVHYWTWTLPGFGLLAVLLLRDVRTRTRRPTAIVAALAMLLLLCVRVLPTPVASGVEAKAIDVANAHLDAAEPDEPANNTGVALNVNLPFDGKIAIRTVARADGVRLLALRRDFGSDFDWPLGLDAPDARPGQRWRTGYSFGYPCWLPPFPCRIHGLPPQH